MFVQQDVCVFVKLTPAYLGPMGNFQAPSLAQMSCQDFAKIFVDIIANQNFQENIAHLNHSWVLQCACRHDLNFCKIQGQSDVRELFTQQFDHLDQFRRGLGKENQIVCMSGVGQALHL